jgi:hypothetical protein
VTGSYDGPELRTERLVLRRWRAEDLGPFTRLNVEEASDGGGSSLEHRIASLYRKMRVSQRYIIDLGR